MDLTGTEEIDLSAGESELIKVYDMPAAPFFNKQDCVKIMGVGDVGNTPAAFENILHAENGEGYFFGGFFIKFIYFHKN